MAQQDKIDLNSGRKHPYHIVEPSPWPMLASFAAGLTAWGAVALFNDTAMWWKFAIGFVALSLIAAYWWRDVIRESIVDKAHNSITEIGMRYGMLLFITSELMFFVAFFWAFIGPALYPTEVIGSVWPPEGTQTIDPFDLPFLMTMILLLSGCTVTWAHAAVLEGNKKDLVAGLGLTVGLGAIFTCFQVYEYMHISLGLGDDVFTSGFYIATGFHGFHVLVGTIFLAVCWRRAAKDHFTPDEHFGFEAAAWYWHFVDVIWLFLFVAIYWWGQ